jgi:hypothetical protein
MNDRYVHTQHDDKEFYELFKSFAGHKPAIDEYRHRQNFGPVVQIFREFLKEFWRHQIEKTGTGWSLFYITHGNIYLSPIFEMF